MLSEIRKAYEVLDELQQMACAINKTCETCIFHIADKDLCLIGEMLNRLYDMTMNYRKKGEE